MRFLRPTRRELLMAGAGAAALLHLPRRALAGECQASFAGLADVGELADHGIVPFDLSRLRGWITPTADFFVRNHFGVPWLKPEHRVEVSGRVKKPGAWSLEDFRRLERTEAVVTLECAGNSVAHNHGMVSNARWAGTPLRALLDRAGVVDEDDEIVFTGADRMSLDPGADPYARSMPVREAVARGAILAWEMNGAPLTPEHGAPLRLVVPGWYGMASVKWLAGIEVRSEPFRGRYQTGSYVNRIQGPEGDRLEPVTRIPLKSILASAVSEGKTIRLLGAAWGGESAIERVAITFDLGETWEEASLGEETAPGAWRLWSREWKPSKAGIWWIGSRAFGADGGAQPLRRPKSHEYAPYVRDEVAARQLEVRC